MTNTHVGGSQPHWESVVLRLRRGITNDLVRYLRKSDGFIHVEILKALQKVEIVLRHPSLTGGQVARANQLMAEAVAGMFFDIEKLNGQLQPSLLNWLADLFEGKGNGAIFPKLQILSYNTATNRPKNADWLGERRIALFLIQQMKSPPVLDKQAAHDAVIRYGLSAGSIRRIWQRHKHGAMFHHCAFKKSKLKRFRKTRELPRRVNPYPLFPD
jgi:hypothetical protein